MSLSKKDRSGGSARLSTRRFHGLSISLLLTATFFIAVIAGLPTAVADDKVECHEMPACTEFEDSDGNTQQIGAQADWEYTGTSTMKAHGLHYATTLAIGTLWICESPEPCGDFHIADQCAIPDLDTTPLTCATNSDWFSALDQCLYAVAETRATGQNEWIRHNEPNKFC